jgi:hypothetical protein
MPSHGLSRRPNQVLDGEFLQHHRLFERVAEICGDKGEISLDQRIESFLADVQALAGEAPDVVREGLLCRLNGPLC